MNIFHFFVKNVIINQYMCSKKDQFKWYLWARKEIIMNKNDLNVLDEVNKGATMGMDAIEFVEKKVGDEQFRETLNAEYAKYQEISNRANNLYNKFPTEKEPHETGAMNKIMTWWGVQMKVMTDQSNSNIS